MSWQGTRDAAACIGGNVVDRFSGDLSPAI
jgi:hypothetical protein